MWNSEVQSIGDLYRSQLRTCKLILDASDDSLSLEEFHKRSPTNWANYRSCQDSALVFFSSQAAELRKGIPILLALNAATVFVAWLIVWGIVAVVRWINRGFASA